VRELSTSPTDTSRVLDRLDAALEASCGALVALESKRQCATELDGDLDDVTAEVVRTIRRLREAIAEVRSLSGAHASAVAYGFVSGTQSASPGEAQIRPRRTA
jgi:hypothetical protein